MKLSLLIYLGGLLLPLYSAAANFKLESMQALLTTNEREYRMEVTNTDNKAMLLVTKVEEQPGEEPYASQIMVFPPVVRIESGATQFIRLRLKQNATLLVQDTLLRLNLTGVGLTAQGSNIGIGISQVIPLVVRSASYRNGATGWKDLRWQRSADQLQLTNTGDRLVRLQPELTLLPDGKTIQLERAWLRPYEVLKLPAPPGALSALEITPFDRKGHPDKTVSVIAR